MLGGCKERVSNLEFAKQKIQNYMEIRVCVHMYYLQPTARQRAESLSARDTYYLHHPRRRVYYSLGMRWTSPPTRREVTLVLFSVTVFIVSYNLDTSFRILGLDPLATQGAVLNKLGLGGASVLDKDGRRPLGWRDKLEDEIFGDWAWDEGHVAGDGAERSQSKGKGPYGALWAGRSESETLSSRSFGETTADDVIDWWGDKMPVTGLVKHVPGASSICSLELYRSNVCDPGYTILDNVFLFNGTVYLVTDTPSSFPSISSIISKSNREWKILSSSQARSGLGQYGGKYV